MAKKIRNNKKQKTEINAPIVEALQKAYDKPSYQFHIPGHTRGSGALKEFRNLIGSKALKVDTTDEFDNLGTLNPPTGAVAEAEKLAAEAFDAERTFFLLNGSTIGNLALAMGITKKGQKIITNRNCHRSLLTGMIISGAEPVWIVPEKLEEWGLWGSIRPEKIENLLKTTNDVGAVWITNPTYEGVISDIKAIADICKKYNVPLIVDEAHGSLWNFNDALPTPALKLGADAVVHSLHKTGGSMSQSSMLHIAKNSKLNVEKIERALKLLHTTSPSLILLASLDAARANLTSEKGSRQIERTIKNAKYLRKRIDKMQNIHQLKADFGFKTDITKVFVKIDGLSGKRLESILEIDFNIEVESASDIGTLMLVNLGNKRSEIKYLADCLEKITQNDYSDIYHLENKRHMPMLIPTIKYHLRDAFYMEKEIIKKENAIGRVSGEVIAECPPGIAILLPGELITKEHLPYLTDYEEIEVIKE
ncbi:aminotransferase class I/II-fold pyridoxal phosphate-dependent enzyme [bacterium]|nr:aminotransferase class I/II-fold pyridoxal phosphate-dependent enzyme [bacterium]